MWFYLTVTAVFDSMAWLTPWFIYSYFFDVQFCSEILNWISLLRRFKNSCQYFISNTNTLDICWAATNDYFHIHIIFSFRHLYLESNQFFKKSQNTHWTKLRMNLTDGIKLYNPHTKWKAEWNYVFKEYSAKTVRQIPQHMNKIRHKNRTRLWGCCIWPLVIGWILNRLTTVNKKNLQGRFLWPIHYKA